VDKPKPDHCIGIDVGKFALEIATKQSKKTLSIDNEIEQLNEWVNSLEGRHAVVLEATGSYHLLIAQLLHAAGHQVFVVNGYQLSQYRKGVGKRAKTDSDDSQLLLRYLEREYDELREWVPASKNALKIRQFLRRRAELVKTKSALRQSLSDVPEIDTETAISSIRDAIKKLEKLIAAYLKREGILDSAQRCQSMPGVGVLTSAALATSYYCGTFSKCDSFISFLGLAPVPKDSGKKKGRRRISKKGDSETRRLLHNAAMAASKNDVHWKRYYESYLDRGLSRTEALVIVARKISRVAFALLKSGQLYSPEFAFPSA
jgi:transposase